MLVFDLCGLSLHFVETFLDHDNPDVVGCEKCRRVGQILQRSMSFRADGSARLRLEGSSDVIKHFGLKACAAGAILMANEEGAKFDAGEELMRLARSIEGLAKARDLPPLRVMRWDPQDFIPVWVSVEDGLPSHRHTVGSAGWFFVISRGRRASRYFNAASQRWLRPAIGVYDFADDHNVTHWLKFHIPDAPAQGAAS